MISREFLEAKVQAQIDYWQNHVVKGWSGRKQNRQNIHTPTQIFLIKPGLFRFVLWNMLGGGFDGHYECIVNKNTFEYSVRQYGCYGNLMSIRPPDDRTIYTSANMSEEQRLEIEASIALTILCGGDYPDADYKIDIVDVQALIYSNMFNEEALDNFL